MLESLLGSKTRARVLRLLLDHPDRAFNLRELVRAVGGGTSSVQAEVERLEGLGLVASERDGRGWRMIRLVSEHPAAQPLAGLVAAEVGAAYAPAVGTAQSDSAALARLNPRIRPFVPALVTACRQFGAATAALFGSATEPDIRVVPRDLDVLVTFDSSDPRPRSERYFGLKEALANVSGLPVDLVEADAVRNPGLRVSIDESKVDLYA